MDGFYQYIPFLITLSASAILLSLGYWVLLGRFPSLRNELRLPRQLILLFLTFVGILGCLMALPIPDSTRGQLLTVLGILLSGIVAFSSTTIVANMMAGLMLRITRPFHTGDFIRIGDNFGRVTERGLFDTEIQTEQRELIALPNTYVISNPVTVVHSSGTVIHANVSLGYDVHHSIVSALLVQAASESGLTDPFVQILELGDHAITYRVSGLLAEVTSMISARSRLYRYVLDGLHEADVEIVSPSFMYQRVVKTPESVIPRTQLVQDEDTSVSFETIVFDKAEQALAREEAIKLLQQQIQLIEEQLTQADSSMKNSLEIRLAFKRKRLKKMQDTKPSDER